MCLYQGICLVPGMRLQNSDAFKRILRKRLSTSRNDNTTTRLVDFGYFLQVVCGIFLTLLIFIAALASPMRLPTAWYLFETSGC